MHEQGLHQTADWSKLPVILCETVGTPGLSEELVRELASHPNIVGIVSWRPSTGGLSLKGFATFCSTGGLRMSLGTAHGVMSPLANVAPAAVMRVWQAFEAGDYEGAARAVAAASPAGVVELGGDAVVGIRVSEVQALPPHCVECCFDWPCDEAHEDWSWGSSSSVKSCLGGWPIPPSRCSIPNQISKLYRPILCAANSSTASYTISGGGGPRETPSRRLTTSLSAVS